jgi:hypothetical protein
MSVNFSYALCSNSTKRARSASIVSDRTHVTNAAQDVASPITTTKPPLLLPPPPSAGTNSSTAKGTASRAKRGARKAQIQDTMSVDGDEGERRALFPISVMTSLT